MLNYEFIALDLETTGTSEKTSGIYEIGLVHVKNGKVVREYESFIRTSREPAFHSLGNRGMSIHHLKTAPSYFKVLSEVKEIIGDLPIVVHNKSFDERFLRYKMHTKLNTLMYNEFICTLEMSRKYIKGLPNYKLGTVANHFNIFNRNPHQALSDAKVCADILVCLLGEKPFVTVEQEEEEEVVTKTITSFSLKVED